MNLKCNPSILDVYCSNQMIHITIYAPSIVQYSVRQLLSVFSLKSCARLFSSGEANPASSLAHASPSLQPFANQSWYLTCSHPSTSAFVASCKVQRTQDGRMTFVYGYSHRSFLVYPFLANDINRCEMTRMMNSQYSFCGGSSRRTKQNMESQVFIHI